MDNIDDKQNKATIYYQVSEDSTLSEYVIIPVLWLNGTCFGDCINDCSINDNITFMFPSTFGYNQIYLHKNDSIYLYHMFKNYWTIYNSAYLCKYTTLDKFLSWFEYSVRERIKLVLDYLGIDFNNFSINHNTYINYNMSISSDVSSELDYYDDELNNNYKSKNYKNYEDYYINDLINDYEYIKKPGSKIRTRQKMITKRNYNNNIDFDGTYINNNDYTINNNDYKFYNNNSKNSKSKDLNASYYNNDFTLTNNEEINLLFNEFNIKIY